MYQEYYDEDRAYNFPVVTRPDALKLPEDVRAKIEAERAEVRRRYENTPQWLKAPNGEASDLSEDLWIAVRTPAFIRWFGDWQNSGGASHGRQSDEYGTSGFASLPTTTTPAALHATGTEYSAAQQKSQAFLLDKNGEPLVVWHSTPARFDRFRRSAQTGFHFDSEQQAYDRGSM